MPPEQQVVNLAERNLLRLFFIRGNDGHGKLCLILEQHDHNKGFVSGGGHGYSLEQPDHGPPMFGSCGQR